MSICSDIYIPLDVARSKVKEQLMYEQERLIDQAIKGMQEFDLTSYLNKDCELYYYRIEKPTKKK